MFVFLKVAAVSFIAPVFVNAATLAIHANQQQERVQNIRGHEADDPIAPGISIGPHFRVGEKLVFAPRLGYIYHEVRTKDRYGGKYKKETYFLLYDFLHPLNNSGSVQIKFGFGTFLKKIGGPGGRVTVPNGSGTSTAYRPGRMQQSFTSSLNFGGDWKFHDADVSSFFRSYTLFTELFIHQAFDSDKRLLALQAGIGANF